MQNQPHLPSLANMAKRLTYITGDSEAFKSLVYTMLQVKFGTHLTNCLDLTRAPIKSNKNQRKVQMPFVPLPSPFRTQTLTSNQ